MPPVQHSEGIDNASGKWSRVSVASTDPAKPGILAIECYLPKKAHKADLQLYFETPGDPARPYHTTPALHGEPVQVAVEFSDPVRKMIKRRWEVLDGQYHLLIPGPMVAGTLDLPKDYLYFLNEAKSSGVLLPDGKLYPFQAHELIQQVMREPACAQ